MSSKLLVHRGALCNVVRRLALEAGELVLRYYDGIEGSGNHDVKSDGSPVTQADREAEKLIEHALLKQFPDIPVIGEESVSEGRVTDLSGCDYFWLVDPLDGTRDFVAGGKDFTVNIALIHKKNPVLGVVYAPERGEMYAGYTNEDGEGRSFRHFEDSNTEKDIRVRKLPREGLTIITSSQTSIGPRMESFLAGYKVAKFKRQASSLKICAVASGKADIYPRFGRTCEWDTAAGDAILRAAGGIIRDLDGTDFIYGRGHPDFENPEFIAGSYDIFLSKNDADH